MPTPSAKPTIEEQRAYLSRIRRGYELAARQQRRKWQPPTEAEKLAFDRLMQDAYQHRKSARDCGLAEWYAALVGSQDE